MGREGERPPRYVQGNESDVGIRDSFSGITEGWAAGIPGDAQTGYATYEFTYTKEGSIIAHAKHTISRGQRLAASARSGVHGHISAQIDHLLEALKEITTAQSVHMCKKRAKVMAPEARRQRLLLAQPQEHERLCRRFNTLSDYPQLPLRAHNLTWTVASRLSLGPRLFASDVPIYPDPDDHLSGEID